MLAVSFFSWWYGRGWQQVIKGFRTRLTTVADSFSVSLLVPTLFEPWRRIITYPGRSLQDKFRAWSDNVFSRIIGFIVRLFVLAVALIVLALVMIYGLIEVLIWPLLPLAVPALIVIGLMVS